MTKSKFKDVVVGLGEIGNPLLKLLSKKLVTIGYDINPKLIDRKNFKKYLELETQFLHICIPFTSKFVSNIIYNFKKFNPKAIVIHSTIRPHTIDNLQKKLPIPIIYSATRGVHKRMLFDLKRYTKFFAVDPKTEKSQWASLAYSKQMKKFGIKTKKMSNPLTLELAKIICDTSYYGWLINYAQISKMIAMKNNVDYDEMWSFAEEIHKFLGNRPKMFPGFIGGHCIIPNLELIQNQNLDIINEINNLYGKKITKTKSHHKRTRNHKSS